MSPAPVWLIASFTIVCVLLIISKVLSRCTDTTSDIALALFTVLEALNRVIMIALIWNSDQIGCLSVIGMNFFVTCLLGLYFQQLVMEPIIKNAVNHVPKASRLFDATLVLAQTAGSNVVRLITSNFMNAGALNN